MELTPLSKGPLSHARPDWEGLDAQRRIVFVPDVGSGTTASRLKDWLGLVNLDGEPLFDRGGDRDFRSPQRGASNWERGVPPGKIPAPNENFARPVEVTAVLRGSGTPSRRTRCDYDGNFCVRYLSPGTYSVLIHDLEDGLLSCGQRAGPSRRRGHRRTRIISWGESPQ